jgi:hypothetical protein
MSRNLGALTLLDPSGPAWPVMGVPFTLFQLPRLSESFYKRFYVLFGSTYVITHIHVKLNFKSKLNV